VNVYDAEGLSGQEEGAVEKSFSLAGVVEEREGGAWAAGEALGEVKDCAAEGSLEARWRIADAEEGAAADSSSSVTLKELDWQLCHRRAHNNIVVPPQNRVVSIMDIC
jgi:hypothetical protein